MTRVATTGFAGRGYEANETGAVPGLLGQLDPAVRSQLAAALGSLAGRGLFAPPVYAVETTMPFPQYRASIPLVWRSGVCAQLRITGRCPAARGQVLLSRRMAALTGWHIGQHLRFAGWPDLTVTGLYRLPAQGRATGSAAAPCTSRPPSARPLGQQPSRRVVHPAGHAGAGPPRSSRAPRWWTTCSNQSRITGRRSPS